MNKLSIHTNSIYNKILVVDLSYFLHRALRQTELWELTLMEDNKERHVGGIYGAFSILVNIMKKYPGYMPIFCSDKGLDSRRLAIYPNYKHAQDKLAENKKPDIELTAEGLQEREEAQKYRENYNWSKVEIKKIANAIDIPYLEYGGVEGDDIMTIVSCLPSTKDCIVVTDDKDLIQLAGYRSDTRIRVYRPMADEEINHTTFMSTWGSVDNFVLYKAMIGDPSDNIPQLAPKVGKKTALKFIQEWRIHNITNNDIIKGGKLIAGELGGKIQYNGRGKNKVIVQDLTPKFDSKALDIIQKEGGHKQANQNLIQALIENKERLIINLNLIDLRKIQKDLIETVVTDYVKQSNNTFLHNTTLLDLINCFGKYEIKELDLSGLLQGLLMAKRNLI